MPYSYALPIVVLALSSTPNEWVVPWAASYRMTRVWLKFVQFVELPHEHSGTVVDRDAAAGTEVALVGAPLVALLQQFAGRCLTLVVRRRRAGSGEADADAHQGSHRDRTRAVRELGHRVSPIQLSPTVTARSLAHVPTSGSLPW